MTSIACSRVHVFGRTRVMPRKATTIKLAIKAFLHPLASPLRTWSLVNYDDILYEYLPFFLDLLDLNLKVEIAST